MSEKPGRCAGCAFNPGTEANLQEGTLLKAQLSALVCEPFYCHANLVDGKLPEGQERLCAGWADMVVALNKRGHYERLPEPTRVAMLACIAVIQQLEDKVLAGEDIEDFDVPAEFVTWMTEFWTESSEAQP